MFLIGPHAIANRLWVAPMAGVSDLPFRQACLAAGAGLAFGEMLTSDVSLWDSRKTRTRLTDDGPGLKAVQIAGADPYAMAEAARACEAQGADLIDINMGCPAKKVCNRAAGSALLQNEPLVAEILDQVVKAVAVPVTLKIRTGWCPATKNARRIGTLAESLGIQALTIHGRTRACRFNGEAEHETVAEVAEALAIPVIANGDIQTPQDAQWLFEHTAVAAVMIGRGAQGNPWLFSQIADHLAGITPREPSAAEVSQVVQEHLLGIYALYGEEAGVRIARKHFAWYLQKRLPPSYQAGRALFNSLTTSLEQLQVAQEVFGCYEPLEDQAA